MDKSFGDEHVSSTHNASSVPRKEVERYKSMYEREREQFEEFQRYSKELESEMELELKQRDKKISDLEHENRRMRNELENIKIKSENDRREYYTLEQEFRNRSSRAEEMCGELRQKLRAVEQANDDLERRERIHTQQLLDIRERYDQCLERCALLEAGMLAPRPQSPSSSGVAAALAGDTSGESMDIGGPAIEAALASHQSPSSIRDFAHQMANGHPSQRLITQMLRKVEAAETQLNSSSSASTASPTTSPSSFNGTHNGGSSFHFFRRQQNHQNNNSNDLNRTH